MPRSTVKSQSRARRSAELAAARARDPKTGRLMKADPVSTVTPPASPTLAPPAPPAVLPPPEPVGGGAPARDPFPGRGLGRLQRRSGS